MRLDETGEVHKSSRWQMFFKIDLLKNLAILTRNHMYWNLVLFRMQALGAATLLKIDSNTDVFLWILRVF